MKTELVCGTLSCALLMTLPLVAAPASKTPALNAADRSFLTAAARIDMMEAHKGEMAENQSAASNVKDFAKTLVQDQTQSYQHLSELAAKTGASIPRGIDASKNQAITRLVHLKGERFDRQFTREEIAAEQEEVALYKREAAHGHNADLKAYANGALPMLENDLRLAQQCEKAQKKTS